MKKLTLTLLAFLTAFTFATSAIAASTPAQKKHIQKYSADLKKLPNKAAPASKVKSLVTRLAKLDPKKAATYYKTGLAKLAPSSTAASQIRAMETSIKNILRKAGLSTNQLNKLLTQISTATNKALAALNTQAGITENSLAADEDDTDEAEEATDSAGLNNDTDTDLDADMDSDFDVETDVDVDTDTNGIKSPITPIDANQVSASTTQG